MMKILLIFGKAIPTNCNFTMNILSTFANFSGLHENHDKNSHTFTHFPSCCSHLGGSQNPILYLRLHVPWPSKIRASNI
ncbi:hypothetical protein KFK09_012093 [Dendrobium nobile]|uniref:Uncharacterized protein n=1 Tax=Dendrobium nobile TaxID=94219 RepID=A0A8T3BGB5_DENNO|nr:hypothetical protein KFK09_012093 [Dendrobium nobile]